MADETRNGLGQVVELDDNGIWVPVKESDKKANKAEPPAAPKDNK